MTMTGTEGVTLPPGTLMGGVTLFVRDLDAVTAYYRDGVGLDVLSAAGDTVNLGRDGRAIVSLVSRPALHAAPSTAPGLYHTAIVFDSRADLAMAVVRIARSHGHFVGAADHFVSQAFYFDDPEGNGVELYWDRPDRATGWGTLTSRAMPAVIDPIDVTAFLATHLDPEHPTERAGSARVGHVHLKVGDTDTTRAFYADVLGFDVTLNFSGAVFLSAGGYHHHLAGNVWHSRFAEAAGPSLGLGELSMEIPGGEGLDALAARLGRAGVSFGSDGRDLVFADPWQNAVRARVAVGG